MPSLSRFGDTTFPPSNYRAGFSQDLFKVSSMLNIVAGSDLCSFYSFIFWFAWVLSGLVVSAAPGEEGECTSSHRNLYNDENCRLEMQIREKYFNFKLIVASSCKQNVHYSPPAQITLETWAIWREILLTRGLYNLLFPSPQLTWTLTFAFRLNINFSCLFSRKLTRCSERNAEAWTVSTNEFRCKSYEPQMSECDNTHCPDLREQLQPGPPKVPPSVSPGPSERSDWRRAAHWALIGQEPDTLSDIIMVS